MKSKNSASSRDKQDTTATSFDPRSGGAVPTAASVDKDAEKQATQAKQATSAKDVLQDPDKAPKIEFSLTMLKAPQDDLVAEITSIGKKYNKNLDMLNEIILDILKACYYFNVTNIYHIAYIFATIARETTFGFALVEEKTPAYLSKLYEPVFIAETLIDLEGLKILILQEHFPIVVLDFIDAITQHDKESIPEYKKAELRTMIDQLKLTMTPQLFQQFKTILQKSATNQEISKGMFQLIVQYIDAITLKFDDPTSQLFLAGINALNDEAGDFLQQTLKQIGGSHLKAENKQSHTTKHNNTKDLAIIINFAKKLSSRHIAENEEENTTIKFQLKIVMLHWLIIRVRKSYGLGNITIGDGEKYRGRGLVQLTGRGQYTTYAKHLQSPIFSKAIKGIDDQDPPDLVADPEAAKNLAVASVIVVGGLSRTGFRQPRLNMSNNKFTDGTTFNFNLAREIVNKDHADLESLADPFLTVLQNQIN